MLRRPFCVRNESRAPNHYCAVATGYAHAFEATVLAWRPASNSHVKSSTTRAVLRKHAPATPLHVAHTVPRSRGALLRRPFLSSELSHFLLNDNDGSSVRVLAPIWERGRPPVQEGGMGGARSETRQKTETRRSMQKGGAKKEEKMKVKTGK